MKHITLKTLENLSYEELSQKFSVDLSPIDFKEISALESHGASDKIEAGYEAYRLALLLGAQSDSYKISSSALSRYKDRYPITLQSPPLAFDTQKVTLPNFKDWTTEAFEQDFNQTVSFLKERIDTELFKMAQNKVSPTFESCVLATQDIHLSFTRLEQFLVLVEYNKVLASSETKAEDHVKECLDLVIRLRPKLEEIKNRLLQSSLCEQTLSQLNTNLTLTPEERQCIEMRLKLLYRMGAQLEPAQKEEIEKIKTELDTLVIERKTLSEAKSKEKIAFSLEDLDGISEKLIASWKNPNGDDYLVPLDLRVRPQMDLCKSEQTRKQFYTKLYESSEALKTLDQQILDLRQKQAQTLGYANYAEYALLDKSSFETVEEAQTFIMGWLESLNPTLDQLAPEESGLAPWDAGFKANAQSAVIDMSSYTVDYETLKKHFFEQMEKLFRVKFTLVEVENLWNENVQVYEVSDLDTNEVLGKILHDPYAVPALSKNGNFSLEIYPGQLETKDQESLIATTLLSTNYKKGVPLSITEAATFYHEMGHQLNLILGRRVNPELSGLTPVQKFTDLAEVSGTVMESYFYNPQNLAELFKNKQGEALTLEEATQFRKQTNYTKALQLAQSAVMALSDLQIHQKGQVENFFKQNIEIYFPYTDQSESIYAEVNPNPYFHQKEYAALYHQYVISRIVAPQLYARCEAGQASLREIFEQGASMSNEDLLRLYVGDYKNKADAFDYSYAIKFEGLLLSTNSDK